MRIHPFFRRATLAKKIADDVLDDRPAAAAASGLFLSSPRRTGKSTFLREDLLPELQTRDVEVLYVDLWKDTESDPGDVIMNAIREKLAENAPVLARIARKFGVGDELSVGPAKISTQSLLGSVGIGKGVSLADALGVYSEETKKTIVLIIDEAQHAMTTEMGRSSFFALKAARDELNRSGMYGLRIVATGSNREKLAALRGQKDQAFFLAPMQTLPHLGRDFVQWFREANLIGDQTDEERIWQVFETCGYRPEILSAALNRVLAEPSESDPPEPLDQKIEAKAMDLIRESVGEQLRIVHSLTPLQSSVLRVMAAEGEGYSPFESRTMGKYRKVLDADFPDEETRADVSGVQAALEGLQRKGLVWNESRGVYMLEDASLASVMKNAGLLDCLADHTPRVRR